MNTREIREIASSLRELSLSYKEFGSVMSKTINTTKPLKHLIGKPGLEGKSEGSRLISAGMTLIAFPDPPGFPSDIIGVSLVMAGLIKRRMKPTTIADVYRNLHTVMKELKGMTHSIDVLKSL